MNSSSSKNMDGDKTRRKRLKVVSACGECRRKKTKCNGEKPCAGCLKAHVECKYVNSSKSNHNLSPSTASINTITTSATSTNAVATLDNSHTANKSIIKTSVIASSSHSTTPNSVSSIESIEERLGAIENILRTLLGSGKNKHLLQSLKKSENPAIAHSDQNTISSSSSSASSSCGDMYSALSPHLVHAPYVQNRRLAREKRQRHEDDEEGVTIRDGHGYQLAPIRTINNNNNNNHINPGTPNIRNLLNNDEDIDNTKPRWYPPHHVSPTYNKIDEQRRYYDNKLPSPPVHRASPPMGASTPSTASAFYRMSPPRLPNEIINNNSATTAAGTLS